MCTLNAAYTNRRSTFVSSSPSPCAATIVSLRPAARREYFVGTG
jgi:hypothetical protein